MTPSKPNKKPKRTFALYLLIFASLVIAWFGILRVQQTLDNTRLLEALGLLDRLPFLLASGIAYTLLGLGAALALLLRWHWAPWAAPLAWYLTCILYWIDNLLLSRSTAAGSNVPFMITANILLFVSALGLLALPKQQRYFNVSLHNPFAKED